MGLIDSFPDHNKEVVGRKCHVVFSTTSDLYQTEEDSESGDIQYKPKHDYIQGIQSYYDL